MKYLIAAALAAVCVSAYCKPLREVDAGNDAVIQLHDAGDAVQGREGRLTK